MTKIEQEARDARRRYRAAVRAFNQASEDYDTGRIGFAQFCTASARLSTATALYLARRG